ncbi:MAG: hypothetical protein HND55_06235 [Pseudomonadota bacterium]|nr:MAG: hypothetical protein HND55_06235 [Pseudomonadota bacterium]
MRTIVFVAAMIFGLTVEASCNLSSARLSAGLVKVGDSDRRVIQSEPDRVVQLETRAGGAAGIRYDFYRRGQTLQIHVRGGRITRVCRVRE